MKTFTCRDAGKECDWSTQAESEDEILRNVEAHGRDHHGIKDFTEELKATIRSKIQELKQPAA